MSVDRAPIRIPGMQDGTWTEVYRLTNGARTVLVHDRLGEAGTFHDTAQTAALIAALGDDQ